MRLVPLLCLLTACRGKDGTVSLDTQVPTDTAPQADIDGDGFSEPEDCNDNDADVSPDGEEVCDNLDNDCDGEVDEDDATDAISWFVDADGDGYGDDNAAVTACELPDGAASQGGDCDDTDADFHPGATEDDCADPTDWNCDGSVGYADGDDDGFAACEDCNDTDAAIHSDATEICNDLDDDCDGRVDEDATDAPTWYGDSDGDGFGGSQFTSTTCEAPNGFVSNRDDCDDLDASSFPGGVETCDSADNDCDGAVDEDVLLTWYADADSDGYGDASTPSQACLAPAGYTSNGDDCDDANPATHPGALETCDSTDNDCNGQVDDNALDSSTWFADTDGDGHGNGAVSQDACASPSGHVANDDDCNDGDSAVHPNASETCNAVDDNCDGTIDNNATDALTWFADGDGDGHGSADAPTAACNQPSGFVSSNDDCDDTNGDVSPSATETCNTVDDDCDGTIDNGASDASTWHVDLDGDGFGGTWSSQVACDQPSGHADNSNDCDDTDLGSYPGANEVCDGEDNDCDGTADNGLLGSGAACPATSCQAILTDQPSAGDGAWHIQPVGAVARTTECDMTTDGGGWTRIAYWNREDDGDTLAEFEAEFTELANNMGYWATTSDALSWCDEDANADVMAFVKDVDVPNGGEVLYTVDYEASNHMGQSATYVFVEAGGADVNLLCSDLITDPTRYSSSELSFRPAYTCGTADYDWIWNGPTQGNVGAEVTAFHLASLHHDITCGDLSELFDLAFYVR